MAAIVWLVDDEESVRRVMAAMLNKLGHEVRTFGDAKELLAAYPEGRPDVVITDVRMPGMDGMELTRELMAIDKDAIVMVVTGFPAISDAVDAMRIGATDFLSKPCLFNELKVRLNRALSERHLQAQLKRARIITWLLIGTLPLWFLLGLLIAYLVGR